MRPRLRSGVLLARLPEGTFAVTPGGPVLVPGDPAAAWVQRLAPYLDGTRTVGELAAGQPAERAAVLRRVVAGLVAAGLAEDVDAIEEDALPAAERVRFAAEVEVAAAAGGDGAARFRRWREARIGVAGPDAAGLAAAVRLAGGHPVPARADLTLDLVDGDPTPDLPEPVIRAMVVGDEAWIGPLGPAPVGWDAAWPRRGPDPDPPGERHPAAGVVLRHRLVAEAARQLGGPVGDPDEAWLVRLDLRTLASSTHPVLPHHATRPAAATGGLRRQVAALRAAPPSEDEELGGRARRAVDPRLGLLREVGDGGLAQLPLRVAAATVVDPRGGPDRVVRAAGPDTATARVRAVRRGLAAYAGAAVDARRLLAADGRSPLLAGPGDDPVAALAAVAAGRRPARVLGFRLPAGRDRGAVVPVDARLAFDGLGGLDGSGGLGGLDGLGGSGGVEAVAGRDWADAVETGLLAHLRRLALAQLGGPALPALDLERVRLDPVAIRYRAALAALQVEVVVRDATGPLGVPAYAVEVGDRVLGLAVARRPADAVREGWEQVLLAVQAELHGEPVPAPLPACRRDRRVVPPRRPVARAALAAALRAAGELPVAVPLDHDPEVVRLVPATLRVLTVRADG